MDTVTPELITALVAFFIPLITMITHAYQDARRGREELDKMQRTTNRLMEDYMRRLQGPPKIEPQKPKVDRLQENLRILDEWKRQEKESK